MYEKIILSMLFLFSIAFALEENFTLNYPVPSITETNITFNTEQEKVAQNMVGLFVVAIVVLGVVIVAYNKIRENL